MSDSLALAQQYIVALQAHDTAALGGLFQDQIMFRRWGSEGVDRARGREIVLEIFRQEWEEWQQPIFSTLSLVGGEKQAALEYRVQVNDKGRLIEYNRAEFLKIADGRIEAVDSYRPAAIPSGPRGDTPITNLEESNIEAVLESFRYSFDLRQWMPPDGQAYVSLSNGYFASGQPHPSTNFVFSVRWNDENADANIEKQIDFFRRRNEGFTWYVTPLETPADLGERLLKHGFVLAGKASTMVRLGMQDLETIPTNSEVECFNVPADRVDLFDEAFAVGAVAFHLPAEQQARTREAWLSRAHDADLTLRERTYIARLGGKTVGYAALQLKGGHAYLNGAATLPEYRGRKIYSTMLRKRLEDVRAFGYQLATVDAEPMSRRVVSKYGFKDYMQVMMYVWMPVIDMEVIRNLVPDE